MVWKETIFRLMKKATVNIVKELVNQLTFTEAIKSCSVLPDGLIQLEVCNTHGLVDNGLILISDVPTVVLDVIDGTKILISGTECPVATEIKILSPTYIHGTVKAATSELTQISDNRTRFQIVYLYEVLQETRNRNPSTTLDRQVELIMFFLTSAKMGGELTQTKYKEYIDPMDNLAEDFIDVLEGSEIVGSIEDINYTIIPHSIAGFYDRIGHVKNLFNDDYSGVELRISLPLLKEGCIDCK